MTTIVCLNVGIVPLPKTRVGRRQNLQRPSGLSGQKQEGSGPQQKTEISLNTCGRPSTFPKLSGAGQVQKWVSLVEYATSPVDPIRPIHVLERILLFPKSHATPLSKSHARDDLLFETSLFVMNLAKDTTHVGTIPLAIA
jgi:hypothetical protein